MSWIDAMHRKSALTPKAPKPRDHPKQRGNAESEMAERDRIDRTPRDTPETEENAMEMLGDAFRLPKPPKEEKL